MAEFAKRLALRSDANRTCYAYYRDMRLVHQHCACDPELISEDQLRDYILHVKTVKGWRPKTIRQTVASARHFFVEMLGHHDWTVFSQIKTKDHDELPPVLTREQVRDLLLHVRLRRYRIPIKLIYCCGLRVSECLSLTIHDIRLPPTCSKAEPASTPSSPSSGTRASTPRWSICTSPTRPAVMPCA